MTVQSTDRKAGPFFSGTILPFDFKVFSKEDIQVIWTSAAGVESILVLDSEYSVTLNPDQDNTPGGSVTLNSAITGNANAVIIGDLVYDQGTDIRNQSGFEPEIVEDALDRVTILVQQLLEMAKRTLRIPASSSSAISTQLPQPTAGNVLGWNGEANRLVNLSPQDIATNVAFGTAFVDQFEGDDVETEFSLSANPALLANMDVQVDGTSLRNGIDFVLLAGAVIKFTTPPAAPSVPGEPNIQVRGTVAVPQGFDTADVVVTQLPDSGLWTTVQGFINRIVSSIGASIIGYLPKGTGAVATTVEDILDAQLMVDYAALRAYDGEAKTVRITGLLIAPQPQGIAGFFQYDQTDTTSADNGGTIIVGSDGRRWKRVFTGPVYMGWFGGIADAVVAEGSSTVTSGTDCYAAWNNAASSLGADGGEIVFGLGDWITYTTMRVPSNVTVDLAGGRVFGQFPLPTGVNAQRGHFKLAVFAFYGEDLDANHALRVGTGDYYVSDPRAFAASSKIVAGAAGFTASAAVTDVVAGDWLCLSNAVHIGWHPANSELVQVSSVAGAVVTTVNRLRYFYSNQSQSLGQFALQFNLSAPPPGVLKADFDAWQVAGWRRVTPVQNVCIKNGEIVNLSNYAANGYGSFAVLGWCAVKFRMENLTSRSGEFWSLDSQDGEYKNVNAGELWFSGGAPRQIIPANGSNNINLEDCFNAKQIEEGGNDISVIGGGFDRLQILSYCRRVKVEDYNAVGTATPAISIGSGDIGGSREVELKNVRGISPGGGLAYFTPRLQNFNANIPATFWPEIEAWFEGRQLHLNSCYLTSPTSPGQSLVLQQAPIATNLQLGNDSDGSTAGVVANNANGVTYVIGEAIAQNTQQSIARQLYSGTLPDFPAGRLGRRVYKSDGLASAVCINYQTKQANATVSQTVLQIAGTFSANGGFQVNDVVEVLITNGTSTIIHNSVLSVVNPGASLIELATAIPAGFSAVITAQGFIRCTRWV